MACQNINMPVSSPPTLTNIFKVVFYLVWITYISLEPWMKIHESNFQSRVTKQWKDVYIPYSLSPCQCQAIIWAIADENVVSLEILGTKYNGIWIKMKWFSFKKMHLKKSHAQHGQYFVNSLWPSDVIWRHRSGSLFAQVMACCLTAPSHYLNQCWLIINEIPWRSPEGN